MDRQVTIEVIPMPEAVRVLIEDQKLTIEWNRPPTAPESARRPTTTLPAAVVAQARELRAQGQEWETVISTLFTWTPTRRGRGKSEPVPLDHHAGAIYQQRLSQIQAALGETVESPVGEGSE